MMGAWIFVGLWVVAFILGVRGSHRLIRRYRATAPLLGKEERRIIAAFVLVAVAITVAAGFYGLLAVRRLLGFEAIPLTAYASALVATAILFIPAALDILVERIASHEGES